MLRVSSHSYKQLLKFSETEYNSTNMAEVGENMEIVCLDNIYVQIKTAIIPIKSKKWMNSSVNGSLYVEAI